MNMSTYKQRLFDETKKKIEGKGFKIIEQDRARPWGGFFVISEEQAQLFANTYFNKMPVDALKISGKLSPKILVVQPEKRLSWQYHHRRAEIWKVLDGPVGIVRSDSDEPGPLKKHKSGDTIKLKQGERHRLVGLNNWGVLAEIWQHTEEDHPSDEKDIVRVQDDFGR